MIRKTQSIHMYIFSCMLEHPMATVQGKSNKWHMIINRQSLNLNLGFKPTPFNLLLVALVQTTSYCHVMIMHHIVHCIDCVSSLLPVLSPLDSRVSDDEFDDTNEDSMLSSEVPGKQNPLVHSDTNPLSRSCSLLLHQDNNDSSFTCCGS